MATNDFSLNIMSEHLKQLEEVVAEMNRAKIFSYRLYI